jgi:hypothetical protein
MWDIDVQVRSWCTDLQISRGADDEKGYTNVQMTEMTQFLRTSMVN